MFATCAATAVAATPFAAASAAVGAASGRKRALVWAVPEWVRVAVGGCVGDCL